MGGGDKNSQITHKCTTPPKQLESRRRRQLDVGSPGAVMRSKPRSSLNRSTATASRSKVLVLKLPSVLGGDQVKKCSQRRPSEEVFWSVVVYIV